MKITLPMPGTLSASHGWASAAALLFEKQPKMQERERDYPESLALSRDTLPCLDLSKIFLIRKKEDPVQNGEWMLLEVRHQADL